MTPLQRGKAKKALEKQWNFDGVISTAADFLLKAFQSGQGINTKVETYETQGRKTRDLERLSGTRKTAYVIYIDGKSYELSKTAYLFAEHLNSRKQAEQDQKQEQAANSASTDHQGNPTDYEGKLLLETVNSIDQLTDEDFLHPTRSIQLPALP